MASAFFDRSATETAESTEPSRCSSGLKSTASPSRCSGSLPTRRVNTRVSRWRSSNDGTPLPSAAAPRRSSVLAGAISRSGSSVSETRSVSPSPSISSDPMPIADFILPSSPSPASVTPRCSG